MSERTINFCGVPGVPAQFRFFGGGIPEQVGLVNPLGQCAFQVPTLHNPANPFPDKTGLNLFYEAPGQNDVPVPGYQRYAAVQWIQDGNVDAWVVDYKALGYQPPYPAQWQQLAPLVQPATPSVNLRAWKGNMCGVRVPGLPPIPGGARDASLVLSWLVDRYGAADRQRIYQAWRDRGYTHAQLSWPDSRANGSSVAQFVAFCQEVQSAGFAACPFLCSKDYDPPNVAAILAQSLPVIQQCNAAGIRLYCVGWELSLWLSPTQVQQLIDAEAPYVKTGGSLLYVHFQEGYASFQQPGHDFASFWNLNIGKLTGILHQKTLAWSNVEYQYRLVDILDRFSGKFNCSPDSGFGHTFDLIADECTAMLQFNGSMSETQGDVIGAIAMGVPPVVGPTGAVASVLGFGNGCQR